MPSVQSASSVRAPWNPRSGGGRSPPATTTAPSLRPRPTYASTRSRCAAGITGPTTVPGSRGSPTGSRAAYPASRSTSGSYTDRWAGTRVGAVRVLVDPPGAERAVVARRAHHGLEAPAEEGHLLQRGAHDPGAGVVVPPRQPVLPDVRRLHGVVVDGDDPRARGACALTCLHGGHGSAGLTDRQLMWWALRTRRRGDITAPRHAESCKDLVNQEHPRVIGVSHG